MDYASILNGPIDLVQAARACPNQARLLAVMDRHGPGLVQMLWRILGHQADVADAYQETFCRLALLLQDGRTWNKKGFIFRIAANIALDMLRRKRRDAGLSRDIDTCAVPARDPDPAAAAAHRDELDRLHDAIGDLPDHLRQTLVLREFGELDYPAVASAMNITTPTARQYRHRAVLLLAGKLKASPGSERI